MKKLVIIDFQEDFYSPSGSLYVKSAMNAMWHIEDLINQDDFDEVLFTVDWHPADHSSFKDNGGNWPPHCIQYSKGASLAPLLLNAVIKNDINCSVLQKGIYEELEEYSAFNKYIDVELGHIFSSLYGNTSLFVKKEDKIIICGLAGDYCVLESLKSLAPVWDNVSVFLPGIASIDDGKTINDFVTENNIKVYNK